MSRSIIAATRPSESPKAEATEQGAALDRMATMLGQRSDAFELMRAFLACCQCNVPIETLVRIFQAILERLGFRYFACCSHVDPLHPPRTAVLLHNYPGPWARTFSELALYEDDPVLIYAERCELPFSWNDEVFLAQVSRRQKTILAEGASMGLARGYTIPIHSPSDSGAIPASCSIVPDAGPIDDRSYIAVQVMATRLYHAARRQLGNQDDAEEFITLPLRERQCLELAARGKSDWEIGRILGLSPCTVHTYVERAKHRLGVGTRMQAVAQALTAKQISYRESARSAKPRSHGHVRRTGVDHQALEIRDALRRELRRARLSDQRRTIVSDVIDADEGLRGH